MSEENGKKDLTADEAAAILDKDKADRVLRCQKKIEQALAEERCTLEASVTISAQGNNVQVMIVAGK